MSQIKEMKSLFEANNKPPPMKPKPRINLDCQFKQQNVITEKSEKVAIPKNVKDFVNGKFIENKIVPECIDIVQDLRSENINTQITPKLENDKVENIEKFDGYSEPVVITEIEIVNAPVEDTDVTYSLFKSTYDLPGLENFDLEAISYTSSEERPTAIINIVHETYFNDTSDEIDQTEQIYTNTDVNIDITPSTYLIEEIYNTSICRNSVSTTDGVMFTSITSNSSLNNPDSSQSFILVDEEKRKPQSPGKRTFFSKLFKRTPNKSSEKLSQKDYSDSDSLQESIDKFQTNTKNHIDNDNDSLNHCTKKPLNSIFNRDWLNSIGDGIRKKACVMSELRNVFKNGKFKNPKKKSPKNSLDANTEKYTKIHLGQDPNYENDATEAFVDKIQNPKSNILEKHSDMKNTKPMKGKSDCKSNNVKECHTKDIKSKKGKNHSDSDSIYDDEGDGDSVAENHPDLSKCKTVMIVKNKSEDKKKTALKVTIPEVVNIQISDNESVYDNEEENEDIELYDDEPDLVEEYISDIDVHNDMESKTSVIKKMDKKQNSKKSKDKSKPNDSFTITLQKGFKDDNDTKKSMACKKGFVETLNELVTTNKSKQDQKDSNNVIKNNQKMNPQKNEKGKNSSKQNKIADEEYDSDDSIYDNEDGEEEVYDCEDDDNDEIPATETKNKVPSKVIPQKSVNTTLPKKSSKNSAKDRNKGKDNLKPVDKKRSNDIEQYASDEEAQDVEIVEVYEEEEDINNEEMDLVGNTSKNKNQIQVKSCHNKNTNKTKSFFASDLKADIKRRHNNIKINIKNLAQTKVVQTKRKDSKAEVQQPEDVADDVESVTVIKSVEETEDEALKNIIKRNLDRAKKTFKLKDPIQTIDVARAIKTIYLESKLYMQFNMGEILDVLEYRKDLVLVKNGVGKCGLTSIGNIQIIKNDS